MKKSLLILLLLLSALPVKADLTALQNKKAALQLELDFVRNHPETYYLLIDFTAQKAYLKADANLLRTCQILGVFGTPWAQTQQLTLKQHIRPITPEPGSSVRQRLLPLDFSGRLTNGSKHRSRLFYGPAFLIQSHELPPAKNMHGIQLSNEDIKALASALTVSCPAIVLPSQEQETDLSP